MTNFGIHTLDSASAESREMLEATKRRFGFVPNLMGVMAEAPATLRAYLALGDALGETSFSPVEQQVIALTVSRHNACAYCMAAHSAGAKMAGIRDEDLEALRAGTPLEDPRLEALRRFTATAMEKHGWASPEDQAAFLAYGYGRAQILEVIVGVAMKTLSNYVNHIAATPLDEAFSAFAWNPAEMPSASSGAE